MSTTLTPSVTITAAKIGKIQDLLGAGLRKSGLPDAETQSVIEEQGAQLAEELVAVVRKYVDARSNMIVRHGVKVDRNRTPQKMLDDMGRRQYTDKDVVNAMPSGEGDVADVYFFKPGSECYDENGLMKKEEVERQYALHGLKPDSRAVAAVNEADPAFAGEKPNGVQWRGPDGQLYYAAFRQWSDGERDVSVSRIESDWDVGWWFGGVPASIEKSLDA